jgi:NADPH:quinone reductase-like Zn-dependent oxidoreductase
MKALQISSFGLPTDVVEFAEIEPDNPGPGQLAVAIEAAPINPSDLTLIKDPLDMNSSQASSKMHECERVFPHVADACGPLFA